jgi:RNA polymerase sigma factor (sigma-70 family)
MTQTFQNTDKLQDLAYYTTMAKKQIIALGGPISKKMLNDEQAVGDVAREIMLAEMKHDPLKGRTRKSWLNQHAIYAIYDYINNRKKLGKESSQELNDDIFGENSTVEQMENKEFVAKLLSTAKLSPRQKICVQQRFLEERRLADIATELGITTWAVSLNIKAGLAQLRKCVCSKS